jgi:hypothetical protein
MNLDQIQAGFVDRPYVADWWRLNRAWTVGRVGPTYGIAAKFPARAMMFFVGRGYVPDGRRLNRALIVGLHCKINQHV